MFGNVSPKVKSLLTFANTWSKDQNLAALSPARLSNQQISPYFILSGNGWSTSGVGSNIPIAFRQFANPVQGAPAYGEWKLQYSLNNSAYTDAISWSAVGYNTKPLFNIAGYGRVSTDNSSTVDTLLSLDVRSSGSKNHIGMSFGSTTRAAWSTDTNGYTEYKIAGTNPVHNFMIGGSIGSQTLISQIYGSGYYSNYSGFFGSKLTAGSADQSVQTTLSTYGSFAAKGTLVTSSTYTLAETETFVYVDPSNSNFCTGTPTSACSTYVLEATCNTHNPAGCSWFSGNACSAFNGTDESTCEGGDHAGCTWDEVTCQGANNTDSTTCESQDDAFGGNCFWDTGLCPSLGADESTCEAQPGCTWNFSPCTAFNGGDQATCEGNAGCTWVGGDCNNFNNTDMSTCEDGHTGCIWDGVDTCNGSYNEASVCNGSYDTSCSGNICTGNYANGNCSGTYGAGCQGTAACSNITNSGACGAESGCTWTVGVTVTLPTTANANRSNTGRVYSIMHVGTTGTVSIIGQTGQPIFQYTALGLFKKGDKVLLHNQNISFPCSLIPTQTPCNAQSGCTWLPVVVCSSQSDQSSCEATGVCSWDSDLMVCTGAGRATAVCSGTYSNGFHWYAHSLERGLNYVEKTANYTLVDIDDVVNCTTGTFTLTLPSAATNNGKQYTLKNTGAGTITLNTTSGQTIDGNASGVLTLAAGDSMVVVSNNLNWIIV